MHSPTDTHVTMPAAVDARPVDARPVDTCIVDARLEAEYLLCHVLGVTRASLYAWPDRSIDPADDDALRNLLRQRCEGVPLAHLTGTREFWSLPFAVSADALVPRPDTETLVEAALSIINAGGIRQMADLGTGTGAVAIAIAHTLETSATATRHPGELLILATDASHNALTLALRNRQALLPRSPTVATLELMQANWFDALADDSLDLIVANPPYLEQDDPHLTTLRHEPQDALVSGPDGLDAIRTLIREAPRVARSGAMVMLEHGYTQAAKVSRCFDEHGFIDIHTHDDLAGQHRVTAARCIDVTRSRYPATPVASSQALPGTSA